jgi:hypothetical protein
VGTFETVSEAREARNKHLKQHPRKKRFIEK